MSTNDVILVNQMIDQRRTEIGEGICESDFFEIFSAEQILKDDDLSYDELEDGIVDGGGDGGIDAIYFFVNDSLFHEDMDISSLKKNISLRLAIIQAKCSEGFSENGIDKMTSSARDLFDLNKSLEQLASVYNSSLLAKISKFRETYLELTSRVPSIEFYYAYSTKATEVHPNVGRKTEALESVIKGYFIPVKFSFKFFGASELLKQARQRPSATSTLRLAENPISTGQEAFVCLVSLADFYQFISDENGHLRSHLFEGNVRDYQGKTEVNKEIRTTLDSPGQEDFWWLNNGVSIICSEAHLSGKTLTIQDAEIVNGLQSSREVYNSLHGKNLLKEPRNLLVRVLKPANEESRDKIIKATNSQTPIPAASLRATDKIHRDIEEYLYQKGFYYDRRKNFYKNVGKPIRRILSIPFVAQSIIACAFFDPSNARARPSSLLKNEDSYKKLFSTDYPLDLYYKCPAIVRLVEDTLRLSQEEKLRLHANNLRFYIAMMIVLNKSGIPSPKIKQVASLDISDLSSPDIISIAETVFNEYHALGGTDKVAKGPELAKKLIEKHKAVSIKAKLKKE